MEIGFAVCGSFCTYSIVFAVMEQLRREQHVTPIFSDAAYSVDSRFFYRFACEVSCAVGRPRIIDGLAVFDKRVILFGSEGNAKVFSSSGVGADAQSLPSVTTPTAVVESVDPLILSMKLVDSARCPRRKSSCRLGSR